MADRLCHFIRDGKRCPFGTRCRFSHGTGSFSARQNGNSRSTHSNNHQTNGQNGTANRPHHPPSASEAALHAWRLTIPKNTTHNLPLTLAKLDQFFQDACKLMEHEITVKQDVVKTLATEGGLQRIRQMVERMSLAAFTAPSMGTTFVRQIVPLFKVITHQDVVESAILEQEIGTVHNYLYGVNGKRAIELFGIVNDALKELSAAVAINTSNTTTDDIGAHFALALMVFVKIVDVNDSAKVNQNLPPVVKTLENLLDAQRKVADSASLHDASVLLGQLQHRFGLGNALPTASSSGMPIRTATRATFATQRDGPGGRHSNDFVDICEIQIMPKMDEIMSERNEYLPILEESQGLDGLLDRQFRLLREESVGQIRDAIRSELESLARHHATTGDTNLRPQNNKNQGARTYSYKNAAITHLQPDGRDAFVVDISFDQPMRRPATDKARKEWWQKMKRFEPEALVCLFNPTAVLFFRVAEPPKPKQKDENRAASEARIADDILKKRYGHEWRATVSLNMVSHTPADTQLLLELFKNSGKLSLLEFPTILTASFEPTLLALQEMKKMSALPFSELLAPPLGTHGLIDVAPPAYAVKPGFRFNLRCLLKEQKDLFFTPGQAFEMEALQKVSTLDDAQAVALINALSTCLALMQGPPGTGKSYVGVEIIKLLLANSTKSRKDGAAIGPIIVVTYTNHALDQLLEHLVKAEIKQIVRIGSRSKSEVLKDCNLREVVKKAQRSKAEGRRLWELHSQREELVSGRLHRATGDINRADSHATLKDYLRRRWPEHADHIFGREKDTEGFEQHIRRKPQHALRDWLSGGVGGVAARPKAALLRFPLNQLSQNERTIVHQHWQHEIASSAHSKLSDALSSYDQITTDLDAIHGDTELRCLNDANVIGITTSGLARNLKTLRKLKSQILVCEEAGEVLEAHLLTAFLPSISHAILIGDHQQLRPHIQNYNLKAESRLGEQYSLDVSLFERLVQPTSAQSVKLPYSTLETQRRMDPSISRLIRENLYPALKDSPAVMSYPQVVGMKKRLFWLDHAELEASKQSENDPTSHWNAYEVEMTAALVNHLVNQGAYHPEDIAVLAPYLGQLSHLRKRLGSSFAIVLDDRDQLTLDHAGIDDKATPNPSRAPINKTTLLKALRIATVDNFQGEEAKVIVISLVRSNVQKKCGFLRTSNRINVLLSRAKHGMYIIGNSETAGHSAGMWADVISKLTADGNLGSSLELQCPRHPDTDIVVSTPDDFPKFSPEGGCSLKCVDRLSCGHSCPSKCHSEVLHKAVRCLQACPRSLKGCDHSCPNYCGDACVQYCKMNVHDPDRILPCGHRAPDLPCWQSQDPKLVNCPVEMQRTVPVCDHTVVEQCHIDVTGQRYVCKARCGTILSCGHSCKSGCDKCLTRKADSEGKPLYKTEHGSCKQVCDRGYTTCNHGCKSNCHGKNPCPPCASACENQCAHSKCAKACSDPCQPCASERCASSCDHSQCSLPCAAPCDHLPCSKRCSKFLSCGHQCPSICGGKCPSDKFCQICAQEDVLNTAVDFIEGLSYREVDLGQYPCIFPRCGHFQTTQSMDAQMSMNTYYELDECGTVLRIKSATSVPFSMDEIKSCAICRGSLRDISRYGRLIRRAMIDEATKKFIVWANQQYLPLASALQVEQDKLDLETRTVAQNSTAPKGREPVFGDHSDRVQLELKGALDKQLKTLRMLPTQRYTTLLKLRNKLDSHRTTVRKEEQPFHAVFDLVQHARRKRGIVAEFAFDESLLQPRAYLLASALLIRCDLALLSDVLGRRFALKIDDCTTAQFTENKKKCQELSQEAEQSQNRLQEMEGHLFYAQYISLELKTMPASHNSLEALLKDGKEHIEHAKVLKGQFHHETHALHGDINIVEKILNGGTFYSVVTSKEMREVIAAMATEFRGTGHWYYCANGHPFTIGECGMPMEQARCPQCGASIGGRNHQAVPGVTRADNLERGDVEGLGRNLGNMRL
ncbi:hypothetical protein EJ08DRAFT_513978 [Tothia fuscella]|uniref:NFX1-type zinc finger-containing protein 1 n=1 Tax=Tothia fuscella TaxID=1048955 RepID=A0A9P4U2U1_9PEZI|nr:hypothetical protein EJ08DRAFT_513978 [Tothia fuscella]